VIEVILYQTKSPMHSILKRMWAIGILKFWWKNHQSEWFSISCQKPWGVVHRKREVLRIVQSVQPEDFCYLAIGLSHNHNFDFK
jgi:hypothetical protein